jgi:hypothetical protein
MNSRGGFGGGVIEAIERLATLRGRQAGANEELARTHRKRLRESGKKSGIELGGGIEK